MSRPLLEQTFRTFGITVGTSAGAIDPGGALTDMIESFAIAVPTTAANSVFFGNAGVLTTTGCEIAPGSIFVPTINQIRQIYEAQTGIDRLVEKVACENAWISEKIPFVCWNLANCFLIASAATNVSITTFRTPFI